MRRFNSTGLCVPKKHFMVDISGKLASITKLVEDESYFVINRPRQYGKTTTLNELYKKLKDKYIVIKLDFERMSEDFISTKVFCDSFVEQLSRVLKRELRKVETLNQLGYLISEITEEEEVILIIDEVDRISNNQLFINFLGLLRSLYLDREAELTTTFKSVILAGVYDIKNLKLKFKDDSDTRYNSPWNIAVNFNVNMSFNREEIGTMLLEYTLEKKVSMEINKISDELFKFTSGYPFLVSRICQIIDEEILLSNLNKWNIDNVHRAVKILLTEHNTLFDDLIKNLENNKNLYKLIEGIQIKEAKIIYEQYNLEISLGNVFGYLSKDENNYVIISNKIFSELIFNYMTSKIDTSIMSEYNVKSRFETVEGGLDIKEVLISFQE
ncbi:MAG: AAA family ATPase [Sarcina sp.]